MREIECTFCHEQVTPRSRMAVFGPWVLAFLLMCLFIIPGIIYILWMTFTVECPECRMRLG